jgi:hypothetical protein
VHRFAGEAVSVTNQRGRLLLAAGGFSRGPMIARYTRSGDPTLSVGSSARRGRAASGQPRLDRQ